MNRFKRPKLGMAVTALAGPLSNVILMLIALMLRSVFLILFIKNSSDVLYYLWIFFEYTAVLSAGLAIFNLFPIPPLDGSKILFSLLPSNAYQILMRYEKFGVVLLAVLLFANVFDVPLTFLRDGLLNFGFSVVEPVIELVIKHI